MFIELSPADARAVVRLLNNVIHRSERLIAAYERKRSWTPAERAMAIAEARFDSGAAVALKSHICNHPEYQA